MNCPICNGEMRIESEKVGVDSNNLPIFHRIAYCDKCYKMKDIDEEPQQQSAPVVQPKPVDLQTRLAQEELDTLNKKSDSKNKSNAIMIILILLAVGSFCAGAIFSGLFFVIVLLVYAAKVGTQMQRKEELEHLASGKKIVNVCPKCKSENITMQMVQKSTFVMHDKTRVSDNINPLHPFTHTNVKKGNDYSTPIYGNQCHCLNCGHVFAKPEVHYI